MALAVDGSSPAVVQDSNATTTTASFSPPANAAYVAFVMADAGNGSTDEALTVSSTGGLSWSRVLAHNGSPGAVAEVWKAYSASAPGSITVSVTDNKGSVAKRLRVKVITGASSSVIGATNSGASTSLTYTSTGADSWGWLVTLGSGGPPVAGTSQTLDDSTNGTGPDGDTTAVCRQNSTTPTIGTSVTTNVTGMSSLHTVAVEILAASGGAVSADAALTETGTIAATANLAATAGAALTVTGTIAGTGKLAAVAGAAFTGTATIAADATRNLTSGAALTETGVLAATGQLAATAGATLAGTATIVADATRNLSAGAALAGVGTVAGTGRLAAVAGAALIGTATIVADATVSGPTIDAALTVTASITATASVNARADAALVVAAGIVAGSQMSMIASGSLQAVATIQASVTSTGTGGESDVGSWYTLLSIIQEAKQLRRDFDGVAPAACPNDGEPLTEGPRGVLFCRFDGYHWPEDAIGPAHGIAT